jgi:hypothetical protein
MNVGIPGVYSMWMLLRRISMNLLLRRIPVELLSSVSQIIANV